jgi:hypothetical protein
MQYIDSATIQRIITELKLASADVPDFKVSPMIVPTLEVNKNLVKHINIVKSNSATNSTGTTIYTTPINQDFYMTGFQLSTRTDTTATSTFSSITAKINGETVNLALLANITLLATTASIALTFPHPIKIDRNTDINVNNGTAAANVKSTAVIYGYVDETSLA